MTGAVMPFDGAAVRCLAAELDRMLAGARIKKISQPDRYDLYFDVTVNRTGYRLLISADPSLPRIYLTGEDKESPAIAPSFCMLLRKYFKSGQIIKVSAADYERAIFFLIRSSTELGELSEKKLIVEIMGKYSNIIVTDENDIIIDAIRHVDFETSRIREIMPARRYMPPPSQNKLNIDEIKPETFFLDASGSGQSLKNYIISRITGFSGRTVHELADCIGIDPEAAVCSLDTSLITALIINLSKLKTMLRSNIFSPCLIYSDCDKTQLIDFYCLALCETGYRRYNKSMSFILDSFYSEKSKREYLAGRSSGLSKIVSNNLARLDKKEKIHLYNAEVSENAPIYSLYGELIIAGMYKFKNMKTGDTVELENYYDNNVIVEIPLNKALSYQKNAEAYFKRSAKLLAAKKHSVIELRKIRAEMQYFRSISFSIENCETTAEIEEIRQELQSQGYIKKTYGIKHKAQKTLFGPHHYISSEGYNIYVGKNNLQNDKLTFKAASSKDIWLHVKDYPGSHVILRYEGKDFTDQSVYEGSLLAAYYSKAGSSGNVSVDHTFIKSVKRHTNKKPGMVYYTDHSTLTVDPDPKKIQALLRKEQK
jgi:predicted ribosome quality control (RQC) complex YloA/Tae2 family protein